MFLKQVSFLGTLILFLLAIIERQTIMVDVIADYIFTPLGLDSCVRPLILALRHASHLCKVVMLKSELSSSKCLLISDSIRYYV
jgi:hypothetical protein